MKLVQVYVGSKSIDKFLSTFEWLKVQSYLNKERLLTGHS
jgi:hypothetical protein